VQEENLAHWGLLRQKQTKQPKQIKMYNLSELEGEDFDLVLGIQVRWPSLVTLLDELPYGAPHTNTYYVCLLAENYYLRVFIEISKNIITPVYDSTVDYISYCD
jgi:hypothetical protein